MLQTYSPQPDPTLRDLFGILANRVFMPSSQYNFAEDYGQLILCLRLGELKSFELFGNIEVRITYMWDDHDFGQFLIDYKNCIDEYVDFVGNTISTTKLNIQTAKIMLESLDSTQRPMCNVVAKDAAHYRKTLTAFIKAPKTYNIGALHSLICAYPIPVVSLYKKTDKEIRTDTIRQLTIIVNELEHAIKRAYNSFKMFDRCLGDQWVFIRAYYELELALMQNAISKKFYDYTLGQIEQFERPPTITVHGALVTKRV